jgi:hypothetical protein
MGQRSQLFWEIALKIEFKVEPLFALIPNFSSALETLETITDQSSGGTEEQHPVIHWPIAIFSFHCSSYCGAIHRPYKLWTRASRSMHKERLSGLAMLMLPQDASISAKCVVNRCLRFCMGQP